MAGSLHSLLSAQREYGLAKAISVLLVLSVLIGLPSSRCWPIPGRLAG